MPAPDTSFTSFVDGRWLPANGAPVIERENPGRSSEIAARWHPASATQAQAAMDAAAAAFPAWADTPLAERNARLTRLLDALERQSDEFTAIVTRENGKPLRDARAEIKSGLADARYALAEAERLGLAERASADDAAVRSELRLEPLGVGLLITPWNFPLATILRKLVPALLYGNTVVVKPSEFTPGPAARLFALIAELPWPPGAASLVLGAGSDIGPVLAAHPALRALSFTGSTGAGMQLARLTAGRDVRLQLEMGGKNSLVVLADADLDAAIEAAAVGGFTCAGQWCTGTGRVIVEQPVHAVFVRGLAARLGKLRIGPGDRESAEIGPVITAARAHFARQIAQDAVAAGATAHTAGDPPAGGHFVAPTVLAGVTETMPVFRDELFVPVLPVIVARDAADAVRLANAGPYGLSASVFSRNVDRAAALARRIESGIVHVNLHTAYREPALPVAGWRDSGRGLPECGRFVRDFFTRPRALYLRR